MMKEVQCNPPSTSDWFITLGNRAISGTPSMLFFALDKLDTWQQCQQSVCWEGEIQFAEYMHSMHPYYVGTLFMGTTEQHWGGWGKGLADVPAYAIWWA